MADAFARRLRKEQTDAERLLWGHLRDRRLQGHKFRRQRPIGRYIVDFACIEALLVVEVDGSQHMEQPARDREREDYLASLGFRVLRFWDSDILTNLSGVRERIAGALRASEEPSPKPLPPSGEGQKAARRESANTACHVEHSEIGAPL
jgi:very-short-patch-repair endonuclease